MLTTLFQMFAVIGLGLAWATVGPGRAGAAALRHGISDLVYRLLLPALVLVVLWRTPVGWDSLRIAASAAGGIFLGLALAAACCRASAAAPPLAGALLLASAWPNATYLGLPVLEGLYGPWGRGIAIQYDLFACTPLLLTLGIAIAARMGGVAAQHPVRALLRVPPLWAAGAGLALQGLGVPPGEGLAGLLELLAAPVVPLMLLVVGMALAEGLAQWRRLPYAIPVIGIQLLAMPLGVWGLTMLLGLEGRTAQAVVLEAAMPTMALGVVICDRYGLNTGVYAAAMTASTLLSPLTLSLWLGLLGA